MCFLNSSLPIDLTGPLLSFFTNSSINALRITNKNHQQIVESSPQFPESTKKTIRAIREFLNKQTQYNNIPRLQIDFANLFNLEKTHPLAFLSDAVKFCLPCVRKTLHLQEELPEIVQDLPISHFFGTKKEFEELPELTFGANQPGLITDSMTTAIMRYRLPNPNNSDLSIITKKPAVLIRMKNNSHNSYCLKTYVHFFSLGDWLSYTRRVPQNSTAELFNHDGRFLMDPKGKKTDAYHELRELMINKKFTEKNGTVYTVE